MKTLSFASDNHSGIHPQLLQAMIEANQGHAASYEQDDYSEQLKKVIKKQFDAVASFMVFNGTAANVLSLQACLRTYQSALCTDVSHLNVDECGAPEKIAGIKLIPLPSKNGKFDLSALETVIFRGGDQHYSQIGLVSITQPTEYGTLYKNDEVKIIKDFCQRHGLYLHIDGARLANAAVALENSFQELTQMADIISFGGAKNGFLAGELVIIRNPELTSGFKYYRKQSLQLPSKTRFFSAPFLRYFENNLWQEIAIHENTMAKKLSSLITEKTSLKLTQPTEANSVFCLMPKEIIKSLRKKFFFYVWNEKTYEVRLMTSFDTRPEDIEAFVDDIVESLKVQ